jgi:hypothetical protein
MTMATKDEMIVTQSRSATPNCGGLPPGFHNPRGEESGLVVAERRQCLREQEHGYRGDDDDDEDARADREAGEHTVTQPSGRSRHVS